MQKFSSVEDNIGSCSFLSRVSRQGRNYSNLVAWSLYKGFQGRTTKLAIAVGISLLSLGSQAAAIGAIYWYGKQMENSGHASVPYLHIEVNLNDRPEWLWGVVIFSSICFVISAAFMYLGRSQIMNIAEQHYARKLEQLVLQSFRLPDPRVSLASKLFRDVGLGALCGGCQRGAITAISFAYAATAVVGGIGAAVFLLWNDFWLTLMILASVGFAALFLYPLTLRAAKSAKDREKVQAAFKRELVKLAEQDSHGEKVESVESAGKLAREFLMRRRVMTELIFATQIGITLILAVVIYYMASEALAGRERWVFFIAYIAALRVTLNGIAQPIRAFAGVSRFYPEIVRYYLFARDMEKIDTVHFASIKWGDTLILGSLPNGVEITADAGNCLALVAGERLRDLQFALLGARLPKSTAPVATVIVDPAKGWPEDGSIVLLDATKLDKDTEQFLTLRADTLRNKVTLIVYENSAKAGRFEEQRVLTFYEGEFQRFEWLGTEEGNAALNEFELKARSKRRKKGKGIDGDELFGDEVFGDA
jgi:hypothetical protein